MNSIKYQCLTCRYVFKGISPAQRKRRVWCPRCHSKRVYPGTENKTWAAMAKDTLKRDNYECQKCGESNKRALVVHHIRPVSHGGTSELTNLITLCIDCHNRVHWGFAYYLAYPIIIIARRLGYYGYKQRFVPISKDEIVRRRRIRN